MRFTKLGASLLGAMLAAILSLVIVIIRDPVGVSAVAFPRSPMPGELVPPAEPAPPTPEVFVTTDGQIEWNGAPLDRAELVARLQALKNRQGSIIFSRAEPKQEPSEAQKAVFAEIQRTGIPFRRVDRVP
jgi:biopolymer transport protein ExbD